MCASCSGRLRRRTRNWLGSKPSGRPPELRVLFANVVFTLREEGAKPSESLGAQLRAAAATGFGDALASLAGLLAFLIGRGPLVVLWCAILYVPARFVWKKWAPVAAQPSVAPGS